jgi:hypothetical protein
MNYIIYKEACMPKIKQTVTLNDIYALLLASRTLQEEMNSRLIALERAGSRPSVARPVETTDADIDGGREMTVNEMLACGMELTDEEILEYSMEPDEYIEHCIAEGERMRLERNAHPEEFAACIGSGWDGIRTREQVIADAVAEQRRMRDEEWDD